MALIDGTFNIYIGKLSPTGNVKSEFMVNDPFINEINYQLTFDKVKHLGPLDLTWHLTCRPRYEGLLGVDVRRIDLVSSCDEEAQCLSTGFNTSLPKTVYSGAESIEFAASWNAYCIFKVVRYITVEAVKL
jgi:hypothetical protein